VSLFERPRADEPCAGACSVAFGGVRLCTRRRLIRAAEVDRLDAKALVQLRLVRTRVLEEELGVLMADDRLDGLLGFGTDDGVNAHGRDR
jgi:hypothetical protein